MDVGIVVRIVLLLEVYGRWYCCWECMGIGIVVRSVLYCC